MKVGTEIKNVINWNKHLRDPKAFLSAQNYAKNRLETDLKAQMHVSIFQGYIFLYIKNASPYFLVS